MKQPARQPVSQLPRKQAVIVISSHVVRGSVGNRAAAFALEVLGHPVWAVPTVTLPWHPGHGPATRITAPDEAFAGLIADLARAPWLGEVGAVLTGYLGSPAQAAPIAKLVAALKRVNPQALYVCDPVLGDNRRLYVPQETAAAIRDTLIPIADCMTPNLFELAWLCGKTGFESNDEAMKAARTLHPPQALITSSIAMMRGAIATLYLDQKDALMAEHPLLTNPETGPINGVGDLSSALFLAHLLHQKPVEAALQSTAASVFEIMSRTTKRNADELTLETDSASLVRPLAMVQMRRLAHPLAPLPETATGDGKPRRRVTPVQLNED